MVNEPRRLPVATLIEDGVLVINDGYRAKNSELSTTGLPFARAQNINDGFHFDDADRLPENDLRKVGIKISQSGDVVFTSKGTVGRFALVRPDTPRFVYAPQLCFWRSTNPKRLDPLYLYYWMNSREFFVQFKGVSGQTDMAEYVSLRDQRAMHITLPELSVQRRIAAILGSLDDKIGLNRRISRTLERMAQTFFKSWFVEFDPVRAKAAGDTTAGGLPAPFAALFPDRLVESELGEIPEGWEVQSLDEIADYLNGLACQKYPAVEGKTSLPVIKIRELRQGITENSDRATAEVAAKYIINDGDILFSWSGSLLVTIWCNGRGVLNQHVFKVTSAKYPKWYYYHATKHHLEEFQRIAADKATTMGHIQRHHLTNAKLAVPPEKLMLAATEILGTAIDRRINALRQARTLARLRDTLLPKLLSGEVELSEAEAAVREVS